MNNKAFISVVFPTWNSAAYVRRSLESTLAAMDEDCELVCVDDGSKDNTVEILHEFEDRDPRILVIEAEHGGCSAARKRGVEASTGDYVLFMDSDDLLAPGAIAAMREELSDDTDILVANVSEKFTDGSTRLLYSGHPREMGREEYARYLMGRGVDFMLHGKLFRRRLFNVYHWATDDVMKGIFHRCLLFQLVCASTGRIVIVPPVLAYFYVRRSASLSAMQSLRVEGVTELWRSMRLLPLPRPEFVRWSLDVMDKMIVQRGIPMPDDYGPAQDLAAMAEGLELEPHYRHILRVLTDTRLRVSEARRLVREGTLTAQSPHLSFVVTVRNDFAGARRTMESIFDTGFRNIEIILVDDGSEHGESVRLNMYSIKYPRIHLRKHTQPLGMGQARMTGIQAARGYAVMCVNAGDVIHWEGVIKALDIVDSGYDVALMGARVPLRLTDFEATEFRPSEYMAGEAGDVSDVSDVSDGGDAIFRSVLERRITPHSVCPAVLRMAFVKSLTLVCTDDDYSTDDLWMLSIAAAGGRMGWTDVTGYSMLGNVAKELSGRERVDSELRLGRTVLDLLHKLAKDTPENRELAAKGVTAGLRRAVRSQRQSPLFGGRRARKLARYIVEHPDFAAFYMAAGAPAPTREALL